MSHELACFAEKSLEIKDLQQSTNLGVGSSNLSGRANHLNDLASLSCLLHKHELPISYREITRYIVEALKQARQPARRFTVKL
jgi:NADPH-dependent glutamate synthase beta subunit-like oxidoreductase